MFHTYEWVADKFVNYVEDRMAQKPEVDTDVIETDLFHCEGCRASMRLVQSVVRDTFLQNLIMKVGADVCWVGRFIMDYPSCTGFVNNTVPPVAESLSDFILSPNYSCECWFGICERQWYTRAFK